jgi:hypothetical protein
MPREPKSEPVKGFEKVRNLRENNPRPTKPNAGKMAAAEAVKAYNGVRKVIKPNAAKKKGK